jgi:hypothetical protein
MAHVLTEWDKKCIEDMQATAVKIGRAIHKAKDKSAIRPPIGDSPAMPKEYWLEEIRKLHRGVERILDGQS